MTNSWHTKEPPTAYKNTLLENSPMENTDLSYKGDWVGLRRMEKKRVTWDRQVRALNMSNSTKQVKVMVVSLGVTTLSSSCRVMAGKKRRRTVMEWFYSSSLPTTFSNLFLFPYPLSPLPPSLILY